MLSKFPEMQQFTLSINYRNGREIAEHYLSMLSEALPAKPSADVPAFETGEVVRRQISHENRNDVIASLLRRLLNEHAPGQIGVVILDQGPAEVRRALEGRRLPVSEDPMGSTVVVTNAARIRGHERQVMIVTTKSGEAQRRNFGVAIDTYIAMSRAVKRLFVIEVTNR